MESVNVFCSFYSKSVCVRLVFLQIFLRVAEETGVDAEPEEQVESSNGPHATSTRRHSVEPETGKDSHSWSCASRCFQACPTRSAVLLYFHPLTCFPKMLPGRKRQSKRGSVGSLLCWSLNSALDLQWSGLCVFLPFSLPNPGSESEVCFWSAEPLETDPLSGDGRGGVPTTGWWLTWQQLRALFIKRWLYARRSRRGILAQVTTGTFASLLKTTFSRFKFFFFVH